MATIVQEHEYIGKRDMPGHLPHYVVCILVCSSAIRNLEQAESVFIQVAKDIISKLQRNWQI